MPQLDLVDDTFVAADPSAVDAAVHDPDRWRRWWPGLTLSVFQDRGGQGIRWNVGGELVGSMELWLQACADGVIVHYYLRADRPGRRSPGGSRPPRPRAVLAELHRRQRHAKRVFWALKDELEAGRPAGCAAGVR